jgi:hypothetical protein
MALRRCCLLGAGASPAAVAAELIMLNRPSRLSASNHAVVALSTHTRVHSGICPGRQGRMDRPARGPTSAAVPVRPRTPCFGSECGRTGVRQAGLDRVGWRALGGTPRSLQPQVLPAGGTAWLRCRSCPVRRASWPGGWGSSVLPRPSPAAPVSPDRGRAVTWVVGTARRGGAARLAPAGGLQLVEDRELRMLHELWEGWGMEDDQIERVRRALLRRRKPPWRVLWRGVGPPAP